jgi:hypothetical protein
MIQSTHRLPVLIVNIWRAFFIVCIGTVVSGCTTMTSFMSLDPFVKNTEKRQELELLAEKYCREKRSESSSNRFNVMPDYPLTTDGCTRWFDASWVSCCVVHDILYWCGGSTEDRKEADQFIMKCANEKEPLIGGLMYPPIRIGGVPWLPTPWRWGYGWKKWPRAYEKLDQGRSITTILEKLNIQKAVEHLYNEKK